MSDAPNTPSTVATTRLRRALARTRRGWLFAAVTAGAPVAALAFSLGKTPAEVLVNVAFALVAGILLAACVALTRELLPGDRLRRPVLAQSPRPTGDASDAVVDVDADGARVDAGSARDKTSERSITGRSRA